MSVSCLPLRTQPLNLSQEIHDRLVEKMPTGAHLTVSRDRKISARARIHTQLQLIFDCCHSGTAAGVCFHHRLSKADNICADLPYIVPRGPWPHRTPQSGEEPTVVQYCVSVRHHKLLKAFESRYRCQLAVTHRKPSNLRKWEGFLYTYVIEILMSSILSFSTLIYRQFLCQMLGGH